MAYLSQPASTTNYGVVEIGDYIDVTSEGVISLPQSVSTTADVTFNTVSGDKLYDATKRVVTTVTPTAGPGISLTSVTTGGPSSTFTVNNTGVLSLTAGTGISITQSTGNITIGTTGTDFINVIGVTNNYTASITDEYIGVNSTAAVTITLPIGVQGRIYTIKDEHGQGSGKITIQPQTGEKINNATNYVISVPFQSVNVVFRAGTWWII
jgi:hypothetical protein